MHTYKKLIVAFCIVIISTIMHFEHFSKELISIHSWRQTQTQSTIISFYEEDMNILNPRRNERGNTEGIFRMEFPLMQWISALLNKIFGHHLLVTRLFMFVIGFVSVLGIYFLLQLLFNKELLSLIGAWAFNFSPSFYYYTINPMPDNLALCFSVWGLVLFFLWIRNQKQSTLFFSGLLISLGAACKLPFILYFMVAIAYFAKEIFSKGISKKIIYETFLHFSFSVLPLAWYIVVIPQWQNNPIVKGITGESIPFSRIIYYYQHTLISTLPELLLNYGSVIFFILGFYFIYKRKSYFHFYFQLLFSLSLMLLLYYFYEATAMETNHDYYLFPFYPVLFAIVGYGAYNLYNLRSNYYKYFVILVVCILPFTCLLRMKNRWNENDPKFNKDLLSFKDELRQAVPDSSLVVVGNDESHFIFLYYIHKKGWGFHNNELNNETLKSMMQKGAEYLYTDSKIVSEKKELLPLIEHLVLEKGSIKVFKLKKV